MRRIHSLCVLGIAASIIAAAQDDPPKPKLSKDPLTKEQISIYRTVLQDYVKDGDGALNLANQTLPLDRSDALWDKQFVKSLQLEPDPKSGREVHLLDSAVALSPKMVLVDRDNQAKTVEENDPSKVIKGAIDNGEEVGKDRIGDAVKKAFSTGLFTFSEIVLDTQHRHAVLAFTFSCGMLCGHGNTIVLKKSRGEWKILKRCGGWIS
jgi:hypothetical protein